MQTIKVHISANMLSNILWQQQQPIVYVLKKTEDGGRIAYVRSFKYFLIKIVSKLAVWARDTHKPNFRFIPTLPAT